MLEKQHPLYIPLKKIYPIGTLDWFIEKHKLFVTAQMIQDLKLLESESWLRGEQSAYRNPRGEGG